MNPMRILLVSSSFFPEQSPRAFRTSELAKELARQGHTVSVLTLNRNRDYSDYEKQYNLHILPEIRPRFYRTDVFRAGRGFIKRIVDRILYQFFFFPELELSWLISKSIRKQSDRFDLLISVAKPYSVHIGCALAYKTIKKNKSGWIADCGDPFTLSKSDSWHFPFYVSWIERWMFKKVDFITVPVESARQAYYPEFNEKIRIIPQGFDFDEIKLLRGTVENSCPTFAYAGALYQKTRNPRKFLEFLLSIKDDYKFILFTGNSELVIPYMLKSEGKIEVRKPILRADLMVELSKMDFLVNVDNVFKEQVPSKLIDYTLIGRPVLNIEPETIDKELIIEFLRGNYAGQYLVSNIEDYRISNVAKQFLELFNLNMDVPH